MRSSVKLARLVQAGDVGAARRLADRLLLEQAERDASRRATPGTTRR